MATIKEKRINGKIFSYKFTCCLGCDAQGKQIRRCTTWQVPEGMTPSKAKKAAEREAAAWEANLRRELGFDEKPSGQLTEEEQFVERTQTGKSVARQNPDFREGCPKKFSRTQIKHALELLESGRTYREDEAMTGISKSTLVRARK